MTEEERAAWFASLHAEVRASYLSDPANPFRQSGRSSGAQRWEQTRRCIADAVPRGGDVMDVGCANGLLLQSLVAWCGERGLAVVPHGIDFVSELVELARLRHPDHARNFEVANAWTWVPRRRYDVVRVSVECVPADDRAPLLRRIFERALVPGGRLIACHYVGRGEQPVDVASELRGAGLSSAGAGAAPGVMLAWSDAAPRPVRARG